MDEEIGYGLGAKVTSERFQGVGTVEVSKIVDCQTTGVRRVQFDVSTDGGMKLKVFADECFMLIEQGGDW